MGTPTLPVMFRAGSRLGESPETQALIVPHAAMSMPGVVRIADVSEFEPEVDDAVYLRWSLAVIFRALYGAFHVDHAWYGGQRRQFFHDGGARFVGIYQYIVASQSILAQAAALIELVGQLREGEVIIADIEEGSGDLAETWHIWSSAIEGALGDKPWDYSGLNFAADHGLQPVDWVAAYRAAEPTVPHTLWQCTSTATIPGIPGQCDMSIYHGTVDSLAAKAHGGTRTAPPANWQELIMSDVKIPTVGKGATGEVVRTIQGLCLARHQTIAVDGAFGDRTTAAVKAVQVSAGFTGADVDGIVGPKTWPALLGA